MVNTDKVSMAISLVNRWKNKHVSRSEYVVLTVVNESKLFSRTRIDLQKNTSAIAEHVCTDTSRAFEYLTASMFLHNYSYVCF